MRNPNTCPKADALYLKGMRIRERRSVGLWLPIMWHLALRGHTGAMIELACWFSEGSSLEAFGSYSDRFSAAGLYRRACRMGDGRAGQHLAMQYFNRKDLAGYRRWLRLAAKGGWEESSQELRYFETRLPHQTAREIGRGRPVQKRDGYS